MMIYKDKELLPGTPEADELAATIMTTLYKLVAMYQGLEVGEVTVTRKGKILCGGTKDT